LVPKQSTTSSKDVVVNVERLVGGEAWQTWARWCWWWGTGHDAVFAMRRERGYQAKIIIRY
jgi:hypothetical protein